jgi:mRNA interferase MazF
VASGFAGFVRGRVYLLDFKDGVEPKMWLVVSNNARNNALKNALAVRLTSSPKPDLASIVELSKQDPHYGRVLCDDIETIYPEDFVRNEGALTLETMMRVSSGLRVALAI